MIKNFQKSNDSKKVKKAKKIVLERLNLGKCIQVGLTINFFHFSADIDVLKASGTKSGPKNPSSDEKYFEDNFSTFMYLSLGRGKINSFFLRKFSRIWVEVEMGNFVAKNWCSNFGEMNSNERVAGSYFCFCKKAFLPNYKVSTRLVR